METRNRHAPVADAFLSIIYVHERSSSTDADGQEPAGVAEAALLRE